MDSELQLSNACSGKMDSVDLTERTLPIPAVRADPRWVLVTPDAVITPAQGGGIGLYARVSSQIRGPGLADRWPAGPRGPTPSAHGYRLVMLDDGDAGDGAVRAMAEVLTPFCAHE